MSPLPCKTVRSQLGAYLEDRMSEPEYQSVQDHLSGCDPCSDYVKTFGSFGSIFLTLKDVPFPEEALWTSIRRKLPRFPQPPAERTVHRRLWPAVAAVFMLLVIIFLIRRNPQPGPEPSNPDAPVESPFSEALGARLELTLKAAEDRTRELEERSKILSAYHDERQAFEEEFRKLMEEFKNMPPQEDMTAAEKEKFKELQQKIIDRRQGRNRDAPTLGEPSTEGFVSAAPRPAKPEAVDPYTPMPSQTSASGQTLSAPGAGAAGSSGLQNGTLLHWHVPLQHLQDQKQFAEALQASGSKILFYSQGLFVFEIETSKMKPFAETLSFLPDLRTEIEQIADHKPVPKEKTLKASVLFLPPQASAQAPSSAS